MNFAHPAAWWLLTLVPVVVAMYLLRRRSEVRQVSSLMFWDELLIDRRLPQWWGKLRSWASLFLQLCILGLLGAAMLRPHSGSDAEALLLVVDNRTFLQMGPAEAPENPAVSLARSILEQNPDREAVVVAAEDLARIVIPRQDASLSSLVLPEKLSSTFTSAELSDVLRSLDPLAESLGPSAKKLFVGLPATSLPDGWELVPVDSAPEVSAITAAGIRRTFSGTSGGKLYARLESNRKSPALNKFTVSKDGSPLLTRTVELSYGKPVEILLPVRSLLGESDAAGEWVLNLDPSGDRPAESEVFLFVPPEGLRTVLVVGEGNPFLEEVIRAHPGLRLETLPAGSWKPDFSSAVSLTVFDRVLPDHFQEEDLESGRFVFLAVHPWDAQSPLGPAAVAGEIASHPLLRDLNLRDIYLPEVREWSGVSMREGWKVDRVVESPGGPLLVAAEKYGLESARWIGISFDLLRTDLPLRRAFPLLFDNIIEWLFPSMPWPSQAPQLGHYRNTENLMPGFLELNELGPVGLSVVAGNTGPSSASDHEATESKARVYGGMRGWLLAVLAGWFLLFWEWAGYQRRVTE
jgi:Ca-activated chloride channel family protein